MIIVVVIIVATYDISSRSLSSGKIGHKHQPSVIGVVMITVVVSDNSRSNINNNSNNSSISNNKTRNSSSNSNISYK